MRISAREDYAVRAMVELALADEGWVKREHISRAQSIPIHFLQNILLDLKRGGLVQTHRGAEGGFRLARSAESITLADVIRVITGPLATIRGERPPELHYTESLATLQDVWIAVRANVRQILEGVTIADVAAGKLPKRVAAIVAKPNSWE